MLHGSIYIEFLAQNHIINNEDVGPSPALLEFLSPCRRWCFFLELANGAISCGSVGSESDSSKYLFQCFLRPLELVFPFCDIFT